MCLNCQLFFPLFVLLATACCCFVGRWLYTVKISLGSNRAAALDFYNVVTGILCVYFEVAPKTFGAILKGDQLNFTLSQRTGGGTDIAAARIFEAQMNIWNYTKWGSAVPLIHVFHLHPVMFTKWSPNDLKQGKAHKSTSHTICQGCSLCWVETIRAVLC